VAKPGPQPPTDHPGEWQELTLESTRTLKARVLVPVVKPKPAADAPARAQAAVPEAAQAARSDRLNDLYTLESTLTAKARVLPASAAASAEGAKPATAAAPPSQPLSIKIKAEREKADLLKAKGNPAAAVAKAPTGPGK
jgi:hypothetical protein